MSTVFAEDVRRIRLPINVEECKNLAGDGFLNTVIQQRIVSLVQAGVWNSGASDNGLVIAEEI